MTVTQNLSEFGFKELSEAGELLQAYGNNQNGITHELFDNISLNFNTMSSCVFLADDNCNVAMMNGNDIELWYSCPYCGHEGFLEDMIHDPDDADCIDYMLEIGIDKENINLEGYEDEYMEEDD